MEKNYFNINEDNTTSQFEELIRKNNQIREEKNMSFEQENEEKNVEDISTSTTYPKKLQNPALEQTYIGLLLENPKIITKYYFLFEDTYFDDLEMLNIYKSVLFTEAASFTPEIAKKGFNFAKITDYVQKLKLNLKMSVRGKNINTEKVYVELKKLFRIRKEYLKTPLRDMQEKIADITNYALYKKMSVEEVESAINQVTLTGKFKQSILNSGLTEFIQASSNNLTTGLNLPFPILTSVFKGIRKGETMAYAMPSNSGKSRYTINIAAYTALLQKQKVLIISNEMSEDKMKLCLITTIINNKELQKLHGQNLHISEGELLEFKFRPDDGQNVEVDEEGYVLKGEDETQEQFVCRLKQCSSQFVGVIEATKWANAEINNSIYFVNITDHTNEELQKIIINYYYKEKIQYVFYDTLKTDTANIGIGEELKKTTTILSNIAQNFEIFIFATLQLTETSTLPINLTINDLSGSRTVKEVLDTLCLIKQINREDYGLYEYSLNEVDTEFFDLEKFSDPNVRYYACVVDKNRAGSKPRLLFRLNLAYNSWEELGYLQMKHKQ